MFTPQEKRRPYRLLYGIGIFVIVITLGLLVGYIATGSLLSMRNHPAQAEETEQSAATAEEDAATADDHQSASALNTAYTESASAQNTTYTETAAVAPTPAPAKKDGNNFRSVKNRPLEVQVFGAGKKTILVLGGIHGDEPTGIELARALISHLKSLPAAKINARIVVLPLVNPDGAAARTRVNAHKIDINRNFPTKNFGQEARASRYYGGKTPASEPEVRAIIKVVEQYKPSLILTFHAPLRCINYDGPAADYAKRLARYNKFPVKSDIGYATPGSLGTYYGRERKIAVVTLELEARGDQWKRHGAGLLDVLGLPPATTPAPVKKTTGAVTPLPTITRIEVSKSQNIMRAYAGTQLVRTYTVSTGMKNCTPVGTFRVNNKNTRPGRADLGTRWIGLNHWNRRTGRQYGIHGTNEPQNIGKQASKGCVRLLNREVEELYPAVPVGTRVTITNSALPALPPHGTTTQSSS